MKKKEIVIITVTAIASGLFSLGLSTLLFSREKIYDLKSPQVEPIIAEFKLPDDRYFNENSINPTVDIKIGPNNNNGPFQAE